MGTACTALAPCVAGGWSAAPSDELSFPLGGAVPAGGCPWAVCCSLCCCCSAAAAAAAAAAEELDDSSTMPAGLVPASTSTAARFGGAAAGAPASSGLATSTSTRVLPVGLLCNNEAQVGRRAVSDAAGAAATMVAALLGALLAAAGLQAAVECCGVTPAAASA